MIELRTHERNHSNERSCLWRGRGRDAGWRALVCSEHRRSPRRRNRLPQHHAEARHARARRCEPAPAPPAPPPKPFPEGAKIGYVVLQRIANESAEGKAATTKIQALQQKKAAELQTRTSSCRVFSRSSRRKARS